jgi:hypothetical protein
MDVLAWLFDQGGRGLCLGLLAYMLAKLALGYVGSRPVPSALVSGSHVARAHARADVVSVPGPAPNCEPAWLRDGWQTTCSQERPEAETLLLLDLYIYLRRSWDDGYEARQTTRGLIAGGAGDQPRPKRIVKVARQWAVETGAGGPAADRLLHKLIDAEVVVEDIENSHSARAIGWRLLRPAEASPRFEQAVGVGIERSPASRPA